MSESNRDPTILRLAFRSVLAYRERFGECSAMRLDNGQAIAHLRGCQSPEALALAIGSSWPDVPQVRGTTIYRVEGSTRAVQMVLDITGRILVQVSAAPAPPEERPSLLNKTLPSAFDPAEIIIEPARMTCMSNPASEPEFYRYGFEIDLEPGMSHQLQFARVALSTINEPMELIYDAVTDRLQRQGDYIEHFTAHWPNILQAVADVHFLRSTPAQAVREHLPLTAAESDADARLTDALLVALTRHYLS